MWPTCINKLLPLKRSLRAEVPRFLIQAFNNEGILNNDEMFIPIRPVAILGKCNTAAYVECPNIPIHHIENAQDCGDGYLDDIGKYYWFDFDVVGLDATSLQLRMVF